jgi:PAS domain S-box-containing protein
MNRVTDTPGNAMAAERSPVRVLFALFIGLSLIIGVVAWQHHLREAQASRDAAHQLLASVADLKVAQIDRWRKGRLADAHILIGTRAVADDILRYLAAPSSTAAQAEVRNLMHLLSRGGRYQQVALFDPQLREQIALRPWLRPPGPALRGYLAATQRSGQVTMTDIYVDAADGAPVIDIIVPIRKASNGAAGDPPAAADALLLLRLDPQDFLFPLVESWPGTSASAETLLARRDGDDVLYLNRLRHAHAAPPGQRRPLADSRLPVAKALRGERNFVEGEDYRGIAVVAVLRAVPETTWVMVAKVDSAELYAPVFAGTLRVIFGALATLIIAFLAVLLWWRRYQAEQLGRQLALERDARRLAARLDQVIHASPTVIYSVDPANHEVATFISDNIGAMTGYPPGDFMNLPGAWADHIHPDDRASALAAFESLQDGRDVAAEYRFRHADGSDRWLQDVARALRDDAGRTIEVVGSLTDVTAAHAAREALRASDERFRLLFHHAAIGIVFTDLSGRFTECNAAFCNMLGYSLAELREMNVAAIIHPDDRSQTLELVGRLVAGELDRFEIENRYLGKDGRCVWAHKFISVLCDASGKPVCRVGLITDVTARRASEQALQDSEVRFRQVYDHAAIGIAITDLQCRFRRANPKYCDLLGYTEAELLNIEFGQLVQPDDFADNRRLIDRLIAGELPSFEVENRYVHKDGRPVWVHKFVSVLPGADGAPASLLALVSDIGAERKADAARRHSEAQLHALTARLQAVREEERTRLAREVHDVLGQLLTGLAIDMAWLDKRIADVADGELRQAMARKLVEIRQLTEAMIHSVQHISSELRPSVLDNLGLDSAIRFEVNRFRERTAIACEVDLPERLPPLDADRATGVFRVLQEILGNVARHAAATQLRVCLRATAAGLMLLVADNGRGITAEQKASAASLGLLGMRERVAQLGGRIEFAGVPGQGTTVTLRLPP